MRQPTKMVTRTLRAASSRPHQQSPHSHGKRPTGNGNDTSGIDSNTKKRRTVIQTPQADDCTTTMVSDDNSQEETPTMREMYLLLKSMNAKVEANTQATRRLQEDVERVKQNQVPTALATVRRSTVSTITGPAMTKEQKKRILGSLRKFCRSKAFHCAKFIDNDRGIHAWKLAEKAKIVHEFSEEALPESERVELVASTFCAIRNASQSACRSSFFNEHKSGRLSDDLKESIKTYLVPNYSKQGVVSLHDSYRNFGDGIGTQSEDTAETAFVWFLGHILVECGANRKSRYGDLKTRQKISDIFTAKDEAWGLLILLNEHHVWEWDMQHPAEKPAVNNSDKNEHLLYGNVPRKKPRGRANKPPGAPRKRFTDGRSGNKEGWSHAGRDAYNQLVTLVVNRRQQVGSQDWETRFMRNVSATSERQYNVDVEGQDPSSSSSSSGCDETVCSGKNTPQEVFLEGDDFFGTSVEMYSV